MRTFKEYDVWPLNHRRMNISDTLDALDSVDMGVAVDHYYKQRVSMTEAQATRDIELAAKEAKVAANTVHLAVRQRRDSHEGGWGDNAGDHHGWPYTPFRSPPVSPPPRPKSLEFFACVPSRGDMEKLIAKVKELCVGVCLDCINGRSEECRCQHPDPWKSWEVPCTPGGGWSHACRCDLPPQKPEDWESVW